MNETQGLEIIKYNVTDAAIAELKQKYVGLVITDHASYETVRLAIADCRTMRTDVEARRKELKAAALEHGRRVDGEAKRITTVLLEVEEPLKTEKQKVDDEKARIKQEKDEAEEARKAAILAKIFDIQKRANSLLGVTALELRGRFREAFEIDIEEEEYQEFIQEARNNKDSVLNALNDAIIEREAWEKQEAARKAEAERLEKQKKDQEETQRKLNEERDKLEADKKAEALRKREEEIGRQAKETAEKELKEKLDRETQEAKEKEEAEALEKKRKAAQAPDLEKIISYADSLTSCIGPTCSTDQGREIVKAAYKYHLRAIAVLREGAEKL